MLPPAVKKKAKEKTQSLKIRGQVLWYGSNVGFLTLRVLVHALQPRVVVQDTLWTKNKNR